MSIDRHGRWVKGCGGRFGGARRALREADGEVVWSRRLDAGVNSTMKLALHAGDGDKKPDHQREHEASR